MIKDRLEVISPTLLGPNRLWSPLEMIEIALKPFMHAQDLLCQTVDLSTTSRAESIKSVDNRVTMIEHMHLLIGQLNASSDFEMCRLGAERLLDDAMKNRSTKQIAASAQGLRTRLLDQAELMHCFVISRRERELYSPTKPLFGDEVEAKLTAMSEDIAEAGKCLALGRSTSAVFHLMRVMELAMRRLGDELGVALVEEKNWQNILDEVNKAIKALDHKKPRTKALAAAASHLYAVKVAWRNEVMHPKQTYTPEQATAIFDGVRVFVTDLAALL